MDRGHEETILFEVPTPLGFRVRVTRSCWDLITTIKHPVLAGKESIVKNTLSNSSTDPRKPQRCRLAAFTHPARRDAMRESHAS